MFGLLKRIEEIEKKIRYFDQNKYDILLAEHMTDRQSITEMGAEINRLKFRIKDLEENLNK